jgi:hypothetical protein
VSAIRDPAGPLWDTLEKSDVFGGEKLMFSAQKDDFQNIV